MRPVTTRWYLKSHLDILADCERLLHTITHEYPEDAPVTGTFDVLSPWAWSTQNIEEAVSRYRCRSIGMQDTRAWVAEVPLNPTIQIAGKKELLPAVCGGIIYELLDDGYDILLLTVNPSLIPAERTGDMPSQFDVLETLLEVPLRKAEDSPKRTKVSMAVPDGHWLLVQFFVHHLKWKPRFVDYYFADNNGAWLFEHETTDHDAEEHETEAVS